MEATIGFDLRSIVSDPSWTVDRRARYLLRRDVPSVRSVDTLVWERPPGLARPPVPVGLWPNLSDLYAAAGALDSAGVVAVRITAFEEDEPTPESLDPIGPAVERYDLLGYDVADYWPAGRPDQLWLFARGGGVTGAGLGASPQRMAPVRRSRRCGDVRGGHGKTSARARAVLRLRHLSAALIGSGQRAARQRTPRSPSPRMSGPPRDHRVRNPTRDAAASHVTFRVTRRAAGIVAWTF